MGDSQEDAFDFGEGDQVFGAFSITDTADLLAARSSRDTLENENKDLKAKVQSLEIERDKAQRERDAQQDEIDRYKPILAFRVGIAKTFYPNLELRGKSAVYEEAGTWWKWLYANLIHAKMLVSTLLQHKDTHMPATPDPKLIPALNVLKNLLTKGQLHTLGEEEKKEKTTEYDSVVSAKEYLEEQVGHPRSHLKGRRREREGEGLGGAYGED